MQLCTHITFRTGASLPLSERVDVGGIVGAIVVVLLLVVLILFGIFVYAGPRFWSKGKNSFKNPPREIKTRGSPVNPT